MTHTHPIFFSPERLRRFPATFRFFFSVTLKFPAQITFLKSQIEANSGTMEAPAARRSKRAKRDPRAAIDAAVRAVGRAQQRAMFTGNHLEESVLRQQFAAMQEDNSIETTDEYELLTRRFDALSYHNAQKLVLELQAKTYQYQVAQQSLKVGEPTSAAPTKAFDCGICLDEKPLSAMRLAMPCGHAFCAACIAAHKEANRTRDAGCDEKGCPICRGPIDSVFKPRF
jgi:hypothetical protein